VTVSRRVRLVLLATLCAAATVGAIWWTQRPSCATDDRAFLDEVKRDAAGRLSYFDGRCWTTKPMPPTDTPF